MTASTSPQHLDIHDHIEQLVEHHTHREPYTHRNGTQLAIFTHLTMVPPLIDQLDDNTATSAKGDVGGSSGYSSRPAASIEAIDTLMFIDDEAARWVRKLGEDDPGDTKACIRRVHALHASQDAATKTDIERAVKRWWSQARITSGWDSPAWRPDNTCPVCEVRRSLRIKLADSMGYCVECRALWSTEEIGLLADWIRLENAEDEQAPGEAS